MIKTSITLQGLRRKIYIKAKAEPAHRFWGLYVHVCKMETLREAYRLIKANGGAPGIDGVTFEQIEQTGREPFLQGIQASLKDGTYQPTRNRIKEIPKGTGKTRTLGLPTVEDKLLQTAVTRMLQPVYEDIFYPSSYGFRPGKSQHQALEELSRQVSLKGKRYIIDADMQNYFGSINHQCLRAFLDRRIKDGVIRKMIDKWLKAGVLDNGQLVYPTEGTPQGGSISPLISNVYLHYVLDEWFNR